MLLCLHFSFLETKHAAIAKNGKNKALKKQAFFWQSHPKPVGFGSQLKRSLGDLFYAAHALKSGNIKYLSISFYYIPYNRKTVHNLAT
jgi:hypothetical protein